MNSIKSNIDVRSNNIRKIVHALQGSPPITKTDLSAVIGLSLPTTMNLVKLLCASGLISECGYSQSSGGRKPVLVQLNNNAKFSVGVEVDTHSVTIVAANLGGETLVQVHKPLKLTGTPDYWQQVSSFVDEVVARVEMDTSLLLGVAVSLPYTALQGNIRQFSNEPDIVDFRDISSYFKYKVTLTDASRLAGISHMWYNNIESSYVMVILNRHISGAFLDRDPLSGVITSRPFELGHVVIHPDGKECVCGRRGCLQLYCSTASITDEINGITGSESIDPASLPKQLVHWNEFFERMKNGNEEYTALWNKYLDDLVLSIINLRIIFGVDIVIGGYVEPFLERDWEHFCEKLAAQNPFSEDTTYVRLSGSGGYSTAISAALSLCNTYFEEL